MNGADQVPSVVRFVELARSEARAFLDRFLGETPDRLARLRELAAASGGPQADQLALTPASLEPLWAWAAPRFSWRDGCTPPAPGEPGGRVPLEVLEPEHLLPTWFDPSYPVGPDGLADSLWLIDGLARYLGETVINEIPTARCVAGHARTKGYSYHLYAPWPY